MRIYLLNFKFAKFKFSTFLFVLISINFVDIFASNDSNYESNEACFEKETICTLPTGLVFAMQPACLNGTPTSDGYLQMSQFENADKINWVTGSDYTSGDTDYANATTIGALPFQFNTGIGNPSGSQDYTVRLFNGASECYLDITVTMNEQDCSSGCDCTEMIYLNEITNGGSVHKFSIDPANGSLNEIQNNGSFWYPGNNTSELSKPHGLIVDLNGNIYIGETAGGDIRKLDCNGNIVPASEYEIDRGGFNFVTNGNAIFVNPGNATAIEAYDICTQQLINEACLNGMAASAEIDWGLAIAADGTIYATSGYGNNYTSAKAWKISPSDFGSGVCIDPWLEIEANSADPGPGDSFLPDSELRGIVADNLGFIYIVERITARDARIHKYTEAGVWVDATPIDNVAGDGGYASAQGIVYSEETGYLYVSTLSKFDDCVSIIDATTMDYVAVGVPSPGDGTQAKGIAIAQECCPNNNNITVDTVICVDVLGSSVFLQNLVNCAGSFCEGTWQEGTGNTGMTYSACDNSVTIDAINACGTFFIESDGTGSSSQCGAFKITVNIDVAVQAEATVFAIQPSCTDGTSNSDGYLQISEITSGSRFNWSIGSTYTGDPDYANATDATGLSYPIQLAANQPNPSGSQDYTVRIFGDETSCGGRCYEDYTVTMNEQDCTTGCNCTEYLYLNETTNNGSVHKFVINENYNPATDPASASIASEIGAPWYDNNAAGETLSFPHGLGVDLNGFLYVGEVGNSDNGAAIRKLTCDGEIIPGSTFEIPNEGGKNFTSANGILYVNTESVTNPSIENNVINAYDLCTGNLIGFYCLDGIDTRRDWGMHLEEDGTMYLTSSYMRANQTTIPDKLWKFNINTTALNAPGSTTPTCISSFLTETSSPPTIGQNHFARGLIWGVTVDNNGNIYIVETTQNTELDKPAPTVPTKTARILKYDSNGILVAMSPWDDAEDGTGWSRAIGIYYNETIDKLFVSTTSAVDDCVSLFDTSLTYLGAAVPSPGDGSVGKGINVIKECCPANNNITIDTSLCSASINDQLFLQELINCEGTICEGLWTEGANNTGFTYNACNNSVTINELGVCGSFTLESDGLGDNAQCGAFTITINICAGCVEPNAVIGNYVWVDENGDGVQDAGEPGIPGVVVELMDSAGNVVATTTTDANGGYIFTDLAADTYTVTILSGLPAGLVPTYDEDSGLAAPDQTTVVTIANGDEYLTADFGYNFTPPADTDTPTMAATAAIGDRIWNDADGDGVQDPGESGIAGVTVTLYGDPDGDGVYDTVVGTAVTDAAGNYIFDGLPPAAYVVEVDDTTLPAGFTTTPTGDPDGDGDNTAEPIVLAPGDVVLLQDFGYNNPTTYSIGDTVFLDPDGDGIVDAGEPGFEGVTVALEDAAGNVIATTTTDANGMYLFPGLVDGTYTVVITDTDNVLGEVSPISDPDGGLDNTSVTTIAGADDLDQDFGYVPAGHMAGDGMIGDLVYIDTDGDGAATAGEGAEGVTVELFAADGTTLLATTTTDENGNYYFGGLDPTLTYVVDVDETTLPGGDVYTNMEDPDGGTTGTSTVDLTATGPVDLDQDFGYEATTPVMISGTIWEDVNADGTMDAAETDMFAGITVNLLDADGNIISSTLTDANGDYSFDNLPMGMYTVEVDDTDESLLGYWHSLGVDSEPSSTTVDASAGSVADVDFGYYIDPAAVGNYVWEDTNGDGIQDAGEPGIAGVAVTLEIDYDGDGAAEVTLVTTTDANGHYSFDNLLLDEDYATSGNGPIYTISAVTPNGHTATTIDVNSNGNDMEDSEDPTGTVATVIQGAENTTANADPTMEAMEASYDFGFTPIPTAVLGNYVWVDENGDGVQDAGEPGIPGVVVELMDSAGNVVATTTTDANGGYIFTDLPADTYTVTVLSGLPTGLVPTYDEDSGLAAPDQTTVVTIANGDEHLTADFGYNFTPPADTDTPAMTATAAIGDRIWNDADGDGVQDPGESGIAGVTVTLYGDPDGDGVYNTVVATAVTDAAGNYIFDGLPPAAYVVEVDDTTLPAGFNTTPTGDPDGDGDNIADPIVLAPGDVVLLQDFGYNNPTTYTIGDTVFLDPDGDGIVDAGEPGFEGVTVALEDAAGNVIATTTTDANGMYLFPGLVDGTYTVVITDTDNVLGEVSPISDPDGGLDNTSVTTIAGADDLDQDFGYVPAGHMAGDGMIGDLVYIDTDGDGAATAGEGAEGVTVELFAADGTTLLATTTTDENGNYYFGGLDPTLTYVVDVDETTLPGGDVYTNMEDPDGGTTGTSTVDLVATGPVDLDQDFGYEATTPVMISGTIWEDVNADGTMDAAETDMFAGITVNLLDADGNIISSTLTDANGDYSFDNLPMGMYTVEVDDTDESLLGYWHSLGVDSEPSSTTVDASAGSVADVDFGYYIDPAAVGNYVWEDTNGDGIQDAGELGIAGVAVTLEIDYDGDGAAEVTLVTTTDANGHYSFDNLLLDEDYAASGNGPIYTISAAAPTGYIATMIDVNSNGNGNDMEDSEDPTGTVAMVAQGAENTTANADPTMEAMEASYDFGFVGTNTTEAVCDFNNTPYETPVSGDVTTNDFDAEDDTQVSFTPVGTNGGMDPLEGTVVLNNDGTYTYTPPTGFSGETSFDYIACDDGTPVACDTATVFIEVLPPVSVEGSPIIANIDATEGDCTLPTEGNLLANDFDPDGRVLSVSTTMSAATVSGVDQAGNTIANAGTLTINSDGTYVFTPTGSFVGVVMQSYTITTANLPAETDDAILEITVACHIDNTTFATDDANVTDVGVPVSDDIMTNDADIETDNTTITGFDFDTDGDGASDSPATISTPTAIGGFDDTGAFVPNAGDLTINPDGTYTFEPNPTFVGNVVVTYTKCDDGSPQACDDATLVITILDVRRDYGDAPVAYPEAWHRAMTDTDSDGALDGATDVWLGTNTSFEFTQPYSGTATGDTNDDAISFGPNAGQFPMTATPGETFNLDITVNSTSPDLVFWGLWIDWNDDGTYDDFFNGSAVTASPATSTIAITTPGTAGSTDVNVRLRADDDPFVEADSIGGKTNGEIEDYQAFVVLPIELSTFRAIKEDCDVRLIWATESEKNFKHFEIERSEDGRVYKTIEIIEGRGTETTTTSYSYFDTDAATNNYYRLKTVDEDGSFAYSKVVQMHTDCEDTVTEILVYPNPISDSQSTLNVELTTALETVGQVKVYDEIGRELLNFPVDLLQGKNSVGLDISNLPAGIYSLNISLQRGKSVTKQFVIVAK